MVHSWWRVLIIYVAGVIAGSLGTSVLDPTVYLAGASGGVYALLLAHLASLILVCISSSRFISSHQSRPIIHSLRFVFVTNQTELERNGICHLAFAIFRRLGGRRRGHGRLLPLRWKCRHKGGLRCAFCWCHCRSSRRRQRPKKFASRKVGEGRLVDLLRRICRSHGCCYCHQLPLGRPLPTTALNEKKKRKSINFLKPRKANQPSSNYPFFFFFTCLFWMATKPIRLSHCPPTRNLTDNKTRVYCPKPTCASLLPAVLSILPSSVTFEWLSLLIWNYLKTKSYAKKKLQIWKFMC